MASTARILDGRAAARQIHAEVRAAVDRLRRERGVVPGLAAVLVGDDPASAVYVRNKGRACRDLGIDSEVFHLPASASQGQLHALIMGLNWDARFHGILVQMPLPPGLDEGLAIRSVAPEKDVDCMHPLNVGLLARGASLFIPATPGGIQQLLARNGITPNGKHVVVCGRSAIVGMPLSVLLMQKGPDANATVTVCHTGTPDLGAMTRQADILVAAMGRPNAITAGMVKPGAVVVDVGINRVEDASLRRGYRLVGDAAYDDLLDRVEAITPVPGGVGPMTIAMLLVNTVAAARAATEG